MKPEKVFKSGPNVASVFCNEFGYTVNLHRRFQDRESQEWKSTSAFRESDLPQVGLLLRLATEYVSVRGGFIQQSTQRDDSESAEPNSGDQEPAMNT